MAVLQIEIILLNQKRILNRSYISNSINNSRWFEDDGKRKYFKKRIFVAGFVALTGSLETIRHSPVGIIKSSDIKTGKVAIVKAKTSRSSQ